MISVEIKTESKYLVNKIRIYWNYGNVSLQKRLIALLMELANVKPVNYGKVFRIFSHHLLLWH